MSGDEIREIAAIIGKDKFYQHFVHRINKEFEAADEERNSKVFVLFQEGEKGDRVGFSVIGHSPAKMKVWGKTFKDEGWVGADYEMKIPSHELMYMYIQPRVRGSGLGKKLFQKTMDFSRRRGIDTVYAYVSDQSDAAIKFYRKHAAKTICDLSDGETTSAFLMWSL